MIGLHGKRTYRPGTGLTDAGDFLFEKRSQFPNKNLLAIFSTPDKMVSSLRRTVFGMRCIHAPRYNMSSDFPEEPQRAALPLDESYRYPAALS